jgi:hypothetical protein
MSITQKQLELHKQWLDTNGRGGQRLETVNANLKGADLRYVDLTESQKEYIESLPYANTIKGLE